MRSQMNISKLQLKNVKIIEGKFDDTLPAAINELGKLHFVFIDGDHRKKPLLSPAADADVCPQIRRFVGVCQLEIIPHLKSVFIYEVAPEQSRRRTSGPFPGNRVLGMGNCHGR